MGKIAELTKQINSEREGVSDRIARMRESMLHDQEILDTHVERFARAVQDAVGEKELAKLESDRNEALKRVEQAHEIIKIISSEEGSKIRRLSAELVGEHLKAINELEHEAKKQFEKLLPHFEALEKGTKLLYEYHIEQLDHLEKIDRLQLDRVDYERYGLGGKRVIDGKRSIRNEMDKWTVFPFLKKLEFDPLEHGKEGS